MKTDNLHFVLVPLLAQGHMIPTLDLARLLSQRDVQITLVSTPVNLSRIQPFIKQSKESSLPINFLSLRLPCEEVGLPEGVENVDVITFGADSLTKLLKATIMMKEPLLLHLQNASPPPSCIIADFCNPWARHVARQLGIPFFVFYSIPCFSLLCEHNLVQRKVYDDVAGDDVAVVVPDLPVEIEITRGQAPGLFPGETWKWMDDELRENLSSCDGVVVNSFTALEREYIELFEEAKGKKVWPVGPVCLCNKIDSDMVSRGDTSSIKEEIWRPWLDSHKEESVLYVCFGTLVRTSVAQLKEIGLGLEASKFPVIWVIKPADQLEFEEWLAGGFEKRNKNRILIVRGWAPQVMILSHPSVGGFLTHCGWNSSLEAISVGKPMLTWPGFADQFLNERLLVDVVRVGISCGIKKSCWDPTVAGKEVQLTREEVKTAVEELMGPGSEAQERRSRAVQLGRTAGRAMESGGSSEQAITQLIKEVRLLISGKICDEILK